MLRSGSSAALQSLHLNARENERSRALWVVLNDRLACVILERAIARPSVGHGVSQPRALADLREHQQTIGVSFHQAPDEALVSLLDRRHESVARQVAPVHALGQRVYEHRRAGCLDIVALAAAKIGDL